MRKNYILFSAIILSILIYLLDTLSFYLFSNAKVTLFEALISGVPFYEIFKRLLIMAIIIISGFYIIAMINKKTIELQIPKPAPDDNSQGIYDSAFISNLSYQIRVPLNTIAGFSELLKDNNLTPKSKDMYLSYIKSSSNFLLSLIKNISDLSRIETGQYTLVRSECNLNKMLEGLLDEFQIRKDETGKKNLSIALKQEGKEKELRILTDPERLKLVLNNLLENALSFTSEGSIEFGYKQETENLLEIYINNSGTGMSLEEIEKIFERFNKLADTDNLPFNGVVLRLALTKSLVKLLGGDIKASSDKGTGITISFTIPFIAVDNPIEEIPKTTVASPVTKEWSDRNILIAEDVELNFIYLKEVLKPTKINVLWANNGLEALDQVIKNKNIDLVLMDILMPEMDGYEASKEIKKIRKDLPIIAQTAFLFDEKDNRVQYFDSYLTKPIWSPQLIAEIEKYIA